MGLKGELRTMLLPDVLQWLSHGVKTGILHLRSPKGITKKVYINKGQILSTASSDPREYLGQFLISRGFISEKQLNMAMETQYQSGIKLGKVLMMVGILEEKDLVDMLRLKAEECLYDLFLWEEGLFEFEEMDRIEDDLVPISLDVTSLILEGIRRKDEWQRISKVITSTRMTLERKGKLSDNRTELGVLELRLLEEIDGSKSLEEISLELHCTEFAVCHAAYLLCQNGLAAPSRTKQTPEEQSIMTVHGRIVEDARKLLKEGKAQEAVNLLRFHLKAGEPDPAAVQLLKEAEAAHSEKALKETLPPSSVLELALPMEQISNFRLTPREGYLVTRINGSWDISSIVKVSPMPEAEVLAAVNKLLELGVVRVKNR